VAPPPLPPPPQEIAPAGVKQPLAVEPQSPSEAEIEECLWRRILSHSVPPSKLLLRMPTVNEQLRTKGLVQQRQLAVEPLLYKRPAGEPFRPCVVQPPLAQPPCKPSGLRIEQPLPMHPPQEQSNNNNLQPTHNNNSQPTHNPYNNNLQLSCRAALWARDPFGPARQQRTNYGGAAARRRQDLLSNNANPNPSPPPTRRRLG